MNWEERKAAYTAKAKTLNDVPKDLKYFSKFNTLKMAVMEKVEGDIKSGKINAEDVSELHTIRDAKDTFGFTERYVNVLMEYAYDNFWGAGSAYGGTFNTPEEAELDCLIKLIELTKKGK